MERIYSIKEEEFHEKVNIYFRDIYEGFEQYYSSIIHGNEKEYIELVNQLFEMNKGEAYFDFYYFQLKPEDKEKFHTLLNKEDLEILSRIVDNYDSVYFSLTRELIPFVVRLSTKEVLFSTIYFTKFPATLWGNYNLSFPIFFDVDRIQSKYVDKVEKMGLIIDK